MKRDQYSRPKISVVRSMGGALNSNYFRSSCLLVYLSTKELRILVFFSVQGDNSKKEPLRNHGRPRV